MSKLVELAVLAAERIQQGLNPQLAYEALISEVEQYPSEVLLRHEIDKLLQTHRLAGQFAIRACRSVYSVSLFDDKHSLLLMALPCVLGSDDAPLAWTVLCRELEGWLATIWASPEEQLTAHAHPGVLPLSVMERTWGRTQSVWAHALATEGRLPVAEALSLSATPSLWVAVLRIPVGAVDHVQARLLRPGALTQTLATFKNRIESLAEMQGLALRVFPPCSWVNAFSLARIAAFRLRAHACKAKAGQPPFLSYRNDALWEEAGEHPECWGHFPEETKKDVLTMVAQAGGVITR